MAMQRFATVDIQGLTPALDVTEREEVYALAGENFIFDTMGPKSWFGNQILTSAPIASPDFVQGIRLKLPEGDRGFKLLEDSIVEWREDLGDFNDIYFPIDTSSNHSRWTIAYLNGYVFFAHRSVGLLAYHVMTRVCYPAVLIGVGVPDDVIACAVSNGRLCLLTEDGTFAFSGPSNGLDYEPRLGQAGFYIISDSVSGKPIMITPYANGCLTWTTGGVMRSEFTGDSGVWRHRAMITDYRPVNSFCSVRVGEDSTIILDERGLFKTRGENLAPFAPLFGEFLLGYIRKNRLDTQRDLRLEWDEFNKLLFVSVSLGEFDSIFDFAFVLYPDLDKWGFFGEKHYGVLPIEISEGSRTGSYFGYVDEEGIVRYWTDKAARDERISLDSNYVLTDFRRPNVQKEIMYDSQGECTIASAVGQAETYEVGFTPFRAGHYVGVGVTPVSPSLIGLGSWIQIGYLRPPLPGSVGDMLEVTQLEIRNVLTEETAAGFGGLSLTPEENISTVDYQTGYGELPQEFYDQAYVNHKLTIKATNDGKSVFMESEPMLTAFGKGARYYACSSMGVWHTLEFRADEAGESFRPSVIGITGVFGGKLL